MRTVKKLTDSKWLNIKEVKDLEKGVHGYQFAERLGIDSIAFVCWDRKTNKILLNNEFKPPVNRVILGAFGGSLDKSVSVEEIVKAEVKEEAGFTVSIDDIHSLGTCFVSTQMNQHCFLYLVDVNKDEVGEREPENEVEAAAEPEWIYLSDVNRLSDWKAIVIVAKAKEKRLL